MNHPFTSRAVAMVIMVGVAASGCNKECPQDVPPDAVVAGTRELVEPDGSLYVCPESGANLATQRVTAYVDAEARLTSRGQGNRVFAAEATTIEVTAPESEVTASASADVQLKESDTTLTTCKVVLKVPERLQAICRGETPAPTGATGLGTGDTGDTADTADSADTGPTGATGRDTDSGVTGGGGGTPTAVTGGTAEDTGRTPEEKYLYKYYYTTTGDTGE